jgi:hypothetical protein
VLAVARRLPTLIQESCDDIVAPALQSKKEFAE